MTKSALAPARTALEVAERALPPYSSRFSPRKFTQHRHFAILSVRQFFGLDYRGVQQLFHCRSDLRDALDLEAVPHWTAIEKAEKRPMRREFIRSSCVSPPSGHADGSRDPTPPGQRLGARPIEGAAGPPVRPG
jgi:hypothetical protein